MNRISAAESASVRRVLVRAVNWIGDAVMATPALGVIREQFPKAEITLLAVPLVAQLLHPHPWVDRVIVFDRSGEHKGIAGRLRLAGQVRRGRFDLAVVLPNSFESALIPWLAGVPRRLGKSSDGRSLILTDRYSPPPDAPRVHEVEYYLGLLCHFGISGKSSQPLLVVTDDEREWALRLLESQGIRRGDFVLGINPGATYGSAKRWYPERFADAARQVARETGARIVVFGGPGETDIAGRIQEELGGECLNVAGRTDVRGLMGLISCCSLFITNDSGPMHIAAALGVPLVAIFGSTDHATTSPYTERAVIVRKDFECAPCKLRECPSDHRCMTAVTADDVARAALSLIS